MATLYGMGRSAGQGVGFPAYGAGPAKARGGAPGGFRAIPAEARNRPRHVLRGSL